MVSGFKSLKQCRRLRQRQLCASSAQGLLGSQALHLAAQRHSFVLMQHHRMLASPQVTVGI
jgi:hypothetical protein